MPDKGFMNISIYSYIEYIKTSFNSTIKRQITEPKSGSK